MNTLNIFFRIVVAACIILPATCFSQGIWRHAEVALKNGSVVKGELNDPDWNANPDKISFREPGKQAIEYSVDEVVSFRTDRPALYRSAVVKYDAEGPVTRNKLSTNRNATEFITDTVFVEVLVDAPIGLARLNSFNGREYFFLVRNGLFEELVYRKYFVNEYKEGNNEQYKQQVLNEAGNCKSVAGFIKNFNYTAGSLKIAITNLNKCNGDEPEKIKWDGQSAQVPRVLGVLVNPYIIRSDYTAVTTSFNRVNWGMGLFFEQYYAKRPTRLSTYAELNFRKFDQKAANRTFGDGFEISNEKIKLLVTTRMSATSEKIKGRNYLEAGASIGYQFNGSGSATLPALDRLLADEAVVGFVGGVGKELLLFGKTQLSAGIRWELELPIERNRSGFAKSSTIGFVLAISRRSAIE